MPKFPNVRHQVNDWGNWLEVKTNAPDLIARDRLKVFGSRIFFSSATDPYQYLELKYRLTRKCLQELLKYQPAKLTLHTRSHLILQDLELLKEFGDKLSVGFSFTTDKDAVRQLFEPKAPSIEKRLQTIEKLADSGITVYASLSPLLPCDPYKLVHMLKPYVAGAWVDQMNWPEINRAPELKDKFPEFFAPKNYEKTISLLRLAFRSPRRLGASKTPRQSVTSSTQSRQLQLFIA